ncbi:MAG: sugar-transfer associated ATP-grasp domain-containing protein [Acidobacteriota bacterium]
MATNLRKITAALRQCRRAAEHYGRPFPAVAARVIRLKAVEKYRPKESFLWGLANPGTPIARVREHASRGQLYRLQRRHNSMSLSYLTEDKATFYAYCQGAGITVPRFHGVYHRLGGWVAADTSRTLHGRPDWRRYFAEEAPSPLAIKPSKGVYARGLRLLERDGDGWCDAEGGGVDIDRLLDDLDGDSSYDSFILQDRLHNDDALRTLSGSDALQTARVVTLVGEDRRPRVLFACFKVINSTHLSDNFDYGTSGNLLADIDLETGELRSVKGRDPSGFGLRDFDRHPGTGVELTGLRLPHWPETRRLAETAALKFMPLRTVGWDIGITPDGPSIVEGNVWWDGLHNAHGHLGRYLRTFDGDLP